MTEALALYTDCSAILTADRLLHFTFALNNNIQEAKSKTQSLLQSSASGSSVAVKSKAYAGNDKADAWSCAECFGVLCEAVSLPCGHSYCRECLRHPVCRKCGLKFKQVDGFPIVLGVQPNIMVNKLCTLYWSKEIRAAALRVKGNEMYRRQNVEKALDLFSEAVALGKLSFVVTNGQMFFFQVNITAEHVHASLLALTMFKRKRYTHVQFVRCTRTCFNIQIRSRNCIKCP